MSRVLIPGLDSSFVETESGPKWVINKDWLGRYGDSQKHRKSSKTAPEKIEKGQTDLWSDMA